MEDGDREAAAAVAAVENGAEDFVVVKAAAEEGGDQGDLAASAESPAAEGGSEDAAPAAPAAATAAAVSKEEVRGAAVACGIGGHPLLIKMVSSAEGWIRGHQRGAEGQGAERQGARCLWRSEGEEARCPLAERLLPGTRTIRRQEGGCCCDGDHAQAGKAGWEGRRGQWIGARRWVPSLFHLFLR
jgi:hypothetical protein